MKRVLLSLVLVALMIAPLAAVPLQAMSSPGSGSSGGMSGNTSGGMPGKGSMIVAVTLGTDNMSVNATMRIPFANKNITSMSGSFNAEFDNTTCTGKAGFSLELYTPSLENVTGKGSFSEMINAEAYPANKTGMIEVERETQLGLVQTNGTQTVQFNLTSKSKVNNMFNTNESIVNKNGNIIVYVEAKNDTQTQIFSMNLTSNSTTKAMMGEVMSSGTVKGPIKVEANGVTFQVNLNAVYSYEIAKGNITVNATIKLDTGNYLTAQLLYSIITGLLQEYNLTSLVKVEAPTLTNPVVTIVVAYNGSIKDLLAMIPEQARTVLAGAMGAGTGEMIPGMSGIMGNMTMNMTMIREKIMEMANTISLMPANMTKVETSAEMKGNFTVDNGYARVEAMISAKLPDVACALVKDFTANGTMSLDNKTNMIEANVQARVKSGDPYTMFAVMRDAIAMVGQKKVMEKTNMTLKLELNAGKGVDFCMNGMKLKKMEFNETNMTMIKDMAVKIGEAMFEGPGKPLMIKAMPGQTVKTVMPLTTNMVKVENATKVMLEMPFEKTKIEKKLEVEVNKSNTMEAKIELMPGAVINKTLALAVMTPENVTLPPAFSNMTVVGNALAIRNTTGKAMVYLKLNASVQNIAVLVIHENGTMTLVKNVTIEDGYAVACVSTQSTYIPVAQTTGTTTNTTTTTTSSTTSSTTSGTTTTTTTTTTLSTTTTTTSSAPTTTTTQSTTTTSAQATTTTQTTATTTSTSTTTTTGQASTTTTTTSQKSTTSSTSKASASSTSQTQAMQKTTTTQQATSSKAKIVAAVIIVIIIIAAAAFMFRS